MKIIALGIMSTFVMFGATSSILIYADALPAGNYHISCRDCSYQHGTLYCQCKGKFNDYYETSKSGCLSYKNKNGHLQCEEVGANNLPGGEYLTTCHGCSYQNGRLSCTCRTHSGASHYTHASGCTAYKNNNGNLECQ